MRKKSSILFLSVILLAFIGPGVYYPLLKCVHRYKVHCWIKKQSPEQFTKMEFNARESASLHLTDEDEFEINGKRFDVISKTSYGETTVVYCVNDSDEELLYARASGEAAKSPSQMHVIKTITLLLYAFTDQGLTFLQPSAVRAIHATAYTNHYHNYKAEILSPPPQL